MADLFFPQLASGAMAQYPIQKTHSLRSIRNVLPDGRLILLPDNGAEHTSWTLTYVQLSDADINALESFFTACSGAYRGFSFLDPTENLLQSALDLSAPIWQKGEGLVVQGNSPDPSGRSLGWTIENTGQADATFSQTILIPAFYQYCLSAYFRSDSAISLGLFQSGKAQQNAGTFPTGSTWSLVQLSTKLTDRSNEITVGVTVPAASRVQIYGLQLEAQVERTEDLLSTNLGGIYAAHFAQQEFVVQADGPDSFATTLRIEANR